jgi:lipid A 3-O-deacylase
MPISFAYKICLANVSLCLWVVFESTILKAQGVNFVRLQESNDLIAPDNGDRYFTQGLKLEMMATGFKSLFRKVGLRPFLVKIQDDSSHKDHYSLSFNQSFYTPANTLADTIIPNDRPFAGTLYVAFRNYSVSAAKRLTVISQLSIGILGPMAAGKEMQNGVHSLLYGTDPKNAIKGWDFQLHNDIYLNYFLHLENAIFSSQFLEANSIYEFNLGTMADDFGIGGRMRMGLFKNFFDPNLGFNTRQEKEMPMKKYLNKTSQLFLFFNPVAKMVLYNALLQGGLYNNIVGTKEHRLSENEISRFVVQGNYGLGVIVGRIKLELIQFFTSREFDAGYSHSYGDVSLSYSW